MKKMRNSPQEENEHMRKVKRFQSFLEALSAQVQTSTALIFEQNDQIQKWTFKQLIQAVNETPVEPKNVVGIFCDGTLSCVLSIFSYVSKGIDVALLNPMENASVLVKQISSVGVEKLIGPEILVEKFSKIPTLYRTNAQKENKDDHFIYFFTSGTTSASKAVVLTESSLCSSAYNGSSLLPLYENDILLSILPFSHVFGFVCSLLWGLFNGAAVALGRGPRHFFDDFAYFKPTAVSVVPQMAAFFALKNLFNPELKTLLIGAGNCPDEIIALIKSKGIFVSYGYGLTETSSGISLTVGDEPKKMAICPDYKVRIAEDGEVLVYCETTMMKGYYNDEVKTRESFTEDGYLKTGDLGIIQDGCLTLIGRKKEIIVLDDGTKIFLPEYEGMLMKMLAMRDNLAVVLDKNGKLTLCICTDKEKSEIENIVFSFNQSHSRGQQIARIEMMKDPLPVTATGKIKRYELEKLI